MYFYPLCALLIGYSYRLYLPLSKLYKSLSPLVTFSHLYSHISGLSGDQLGDQLGDKVTNFCHPIKTARRRLVFKRGLVRWGCRQNPGASTGAKVAMRCVRVALF